MLHSARRPRLGGGHKRAIFTSPEIVRHRKFGPPCGLIIHDLLAKGTHDLMIAGCTKTRQKGKPVLSFSRYSLFKCELHNESLSGVQEVRKAAAKEWSSYVNTAAYSHRHRRMIRAAKRFLVRVFRGELSPPEAKFKL